MRSRALREWVLLAVAAAALAAGGCSRPSDSDPLTAARRNLRIAACGPAPAVAGVAGVNPEPRGVYLGDWIVVAVCRLDELVQRAEAAQQPIALFIEGLDSGNEPSGLDLDSGIVTFTLDRDEDNKELWGPLLYDPLFDPTTTMRVSAGIRGDRPLPRVAGANLTLVLHKVYPGWDTLGWLAGLAVLVGALVQYARKSELLRDVPPIGGVRQPYSLGPRRWPGGSS